MRFATACTFLTLLTSSCGIFTPSAPPRVSTAGERAEALGYLATAAKLLEAARIGAWVSAKEYDDGVASIAALKARVDASETVPTSWQSILDDVLVLALRWVPAKK